MKRIKSLFSTTKKAIITSICALVIILGIGCASAYAAGAVNESSSIGTQNAQNFAFVDAGVDPNSAQIIKTEFDFEMGQFVYEVEFVAEGVEYEYWIKASNGTVLKKEVEIITLQGDSLTATANLTLDQAKEIALTDAQVNISDVTFTQGKLDIDDGVSIYDIDFYVDNTEYEYEINAQNGQIYSKSKETIIKQQTTNNPPKQNSDNKPVQDKLQVSNEISIEDAKGIALNDAGLSIGNVTFTKTETDYDDGIKKYEIDFYTTEHKYEYDINANSGAILDKDIESLKQTKTEVKPQESKPEDKPVQQDEYIGMDNAKNIAVSQAGLSISDVTFKKAKLDVDDGMAVYEIEFLHGGVEYECEINANSGAVVDYDFEIDD